MFNEANSVEDYIRDLLSSATPAPQPGSVREERATYRALGWEFIPGPQLPHSTGDVVIEHHLHEALVRLNPEIAARPDNADEVLYRLRAIIQSVRGDGLVRANETFTAWLRGEQSRPFGPDGQHVPVRLIDFDNPQNNRLVVSTQVTYGPPEKRFDIVLFVNGIPLVVGETKTPSRPSVSWVDGAHDIHDDYEKSVPAFFVPNVFSFATEGKTYRFGSIRMPLDLWAPWREGDSEVGGLAEVRTAVLGMLRPAIVLDILRYFTVFATDKQHRKIKIICRYQQYQAANQIVERVIQGRIKKGLIWHFQGSGKSLLMVFAAQKLRLDAALRNPTVLIVVDRIDLDTQITATFNAADVANTVAAGSREALQTLLAQDVRKEVRERLEQANPGLYEARGLLTTLTNAELNLRQRLGEVRARYAPEPEPEPAPTGQGARLQWSSLAGQRHIRSAEELEQVLDEVRARVLAELERQETVILE
jgi:type I restriction enzyme R subunit